MIDFYFLVNDFGKSSNQNNNSTSKISSIIKGNSYICQNKNKCFIYIKYLINILILVGSKKLSKVFKKLQINSKSGK